MDNYVVVYFECDNTYSVVSDSTNKFKNSTKAKVQFERDKWYEGTIVCRGSKSKCQNYVDFRLNNSTFVPTDESDIEQIEDVQLNNALKKFTSILKRLKN